MIAGAQILRAGLLVARRRLGFGSVVFVRVAVMDHESACVGCLLRCVSRRACVCAVACGCGSQFICGTRIDVRTVRCSIAGLKNYAFRHDFVVLDPETFPPGKKLPAGENVGTTTPTTSTTEGEKKNKISD